MKFGIVISVSKTKFGPVVFKENLTDNIIKAASMGYDGVELAIRDPKAIKISKVLELLDKYNMKVLSVGTGQIYVEDNLSFSDPDKDIRDRAVNRTKKIIDIAKQFKASIIIGLIRGKINNPDNFESKLEKAEILISQCIQELLSYSEEHDQKFLMEPINRYEVDIFNRVDEVYSFLSRFKDRLDLGRVSILADTFHMNIEEPDIAESFNKYSSMIKHIHFADSNRWPPGYGHIDFDKIMQVLKDINYSNFISFEMLPLPDPDSAAKEAINNIKQFLKR